MDVRSPFFQNIAAILAGVMFLNPIVSAAAELTAAAGSGVTIGQAGNGVPVVNIAAPNGNGLSHNKFKDYNVGQQGLILNNATTATQSTQLGGIILGNSKLNGKAAGMILNEVTGSNASRLQGYTEVAGKSAHVIVANPHGISCDGCGFINTPRVTLSTGTPVIENGRLDRFDVNGGQIAIEGQGLNASNIDQFDLITRSAKINAELHANKLNVIAGRNVVKADDLSVIAKTPDGSDKPLLAIDSSALGGMYAGAIRLVGTEAGVGVKLAGDMAASAGDIQIDASGRLSMGRSAAARDLQIAAQQVELNGDAYAAGSARISAQENLINRQSLAIGGSGVLRAGELTNEGVVEAGVKADNSRNASADLTLAAETIRNSGTLIAGRTLEATASQTLNNQGGTLSAGTTRIDTSALNNQQGRVLGSQQVTVNAAQLDNRDGLLQSRGNAELRGDSLDNRGGDIVALGDLTVAAGMLNNGEQGRITAQGQARLETEALNNRGGLVSGKQVSVRAADLIDNRDGGLIVSDGALDLNAGRLDSSNGGEVSARGDLTADLGSLSQAGGRMIGEAAVALQFNNGELDNRGGLIHGKGPVSLAGADTLDNRGGEVSSSSSLTVGAERLDNGQGGRLIAAQTLDAQAEQLNNQGGLVSGWQGVTVSGGSLDNSQGGTLSSRSGGVKLELSGHLDNSGEGALVSRGDQQLHAASLDNRGNGIISSEGAITAELDAALDNGSGGLISATGELELQAGTVRNVGGQLGGASDVRVRAESLDNSSGQLTATGTLDLLLGAALLNSGGRLASGRDLLLHAGDIDNRSGRITSQGLLDLFAASLTNAGGTVGAQASLAIQATGTLDNSADGLVFSQADSVTVAAGDLDNRQGALQGQANVLVKTAGAVDNRGGSILSQQGDIDVEAASLDNGNGGILNSLVGQLKLATSGLFGNVGGTTQAQTLSVQAGRLDNSQGHLSAIGGDSRITTGDLLNVGGGLYARDAVEIEAEALDNSAGKVGAQYIDFSLRGILNNTAGLVESASGLTVHSAGLTNDSGALRALGQLESTVITTSGVLDNRRGLIESASRDLSLNLGSFLNDGGTVRHVGSGTFGLASSLATAAGGTLITNGALKLDAANWTHSGVIQAKRLELNVGDFTQTASGQLLAGESLVATGGRWVNNGVIASDGGVDLTLTGQYSGSGQLTALDDVSLYVGAMELGGAGRVTVGGSLTLGALGALNNAGRVTAGKNLELFAASLDNSGTLGVAGQASLKTASVLNARGLVFSGEDLSVTADTVTNRYGDFYSLGSLRIKGLSVPSAALIDNVSGAMEAAGDVELRAQTLRNRREAFSLERTLVESAIGIYCYDCSGDHYTVDYIVRDIYEGKISAASPAASITAGRDLSLSGGAISNEGSTLAAGRNIDISASSFANIGAAGGTIERIRTFYSGRLTDGSVRRFVEGDIDDYNQLYNPSYPGYYYRTTNGAIRLALPTVYDECADGCWEVTGWYDSVTKAEVRIPLSYNRRPPTSMFNAEAVKAAVLPSRLFNYDLVSDTEIVRGGGSDVQNAVVQAGGNVTIQASQTLTNSVITPGSAVQRGANQVGSTSATGTGQPLVVELISHLPPDLAQQQVNPLTLPGFALPQGDNGLFRLNAEAASNVATTEAGSAALIGQPMPQAGTNTDLSRPAGRHRYLIETNPALTDLKQFMGSDYLLGHLGYDPDAAQKRLGDGLYEQRLIREAIVARTGQRYLAGLTSDEAMFRYLMDNALASKNALGLSLGVSLTAEQVASLTHDIVWLEEQEVMGEKVLVPVLYLAQAEGRLAPNGALIQGQDVALISGSDLTNRGTLRASQNLDITAGNILNLGGAMEANERLQLLATQSIRNAQGGVIAGRDVSAIALTGDIINERTVIRDEVRYGSRHSITDYVGDASTIQATRDLTLAAGRDLINRGSTLQSGGDLDLSAGGDVSLVSAETQQREARANGRRYLDEHIRQYAGEVIAGGNVTVNAGTDLTVAATTVKAGEDVALSAGSNVVIAAAANEDHFYSKTKKVKRQKDTVRQQAAQIQAGGDVSVAATDDLVLSASQVQAGGEAYLVAGGQVAVLAAQDEDYSLYEKKSSGSFGRKSYRKDEKTSVRNIGSTITSGGDLTLASGDDQLYQRARLDSGGDLMLESGGAITFEGVKDLEQESHEKSKNSFVWTSAKGKGKTDETLQQSVLIAKGETVIKAVDGLKIDVRQVNKQTVSQTIDAMVKADAELAWIKEAEARGDVDWRRVKEVHDSFKYSHSGLGGGAAMIIAIIVAYFTAGAASGLVASAATSAGATATATAAGGAWAAGTGASLAGIGWANAAATAVLTSAASGAAVSTINNRGNLGAVLKDVTSEEALKGYAVGAVTAGLTTGLYSKWTGTETAANTAGAATGNAGALANSGAVATSGGLSTWSGIGQFAANQALQNGTSTLLSKALGQGGNLGDALQTTLANTFAAAGFNLVGDISLPGQLDLNEGSLGKIGLHAVMGGLAAEAAGGDFKTGALAAGINEALVGHLAEQYGAMTDDKKKALLVMNSQLIGVLAAGAQGGDEKDLQTGAWVAGSATQYNFIKHDEANKLAEELVGCRQAGDQAACRSDVESRYRILSDSRQGTALYACKEQGTCPQQLDDALAGSAQLDWLVEGNGASRFTAEELDILAVFQSSNHDDDFGARIPALEQAIQESGIADGVLIGAGIGAARGGAGGKAPTGAKGTAAAEVPATSATTRVGLREDLAAQAGVPRNMVGAPANVWGKSIDDIQQSFKMDGAKLTYVPPRPGTSGNAQVYKVEGGTTGIKEIQYSQSTVNAPVKSVHVGEYYKITYVDGSKAKVIDPSTYRPTFQGPSKPIYDANTTYLNPQGQKVKFNPATNTWVSE
jgi:filamentous hemagglutinin